MTSTTLHAWTISVSKFNTIYQTPSRETGQYPWLSNAANAGERLEHLTINEDLESRIHLNNRHNYPVSNSDKERKRVISAIRACAENAISCMAMAFERSKWGLKNLRFMFARHPLRTDHSCDSSEDWLTRGGLIFYLTYVAYFLLKSQCDSVDS
jgi:hypothetical protein